MPTRSARSNGLGSMGSGKPDARTDQQRGVNVQPDHARRELARMNRQRDFPHSTCPASRHAAMIAEALILGRPYPMLVEEPEHCGGSIASAVASAWSARRQLHRLGWTWRHDALGQVRWVRIAEEE